MVGIGGMKGQYLGSLAKRSGNPEQYISQGLQAGNFDLRTAADALQAIKLATPAQASGNSVLDDLLAATQAQANAAQAKAEQLAQLVQRSHKRPELAGIPQLAGIAQPQPPQQPQQPQMPEDTGIAGLNPPVNMAGGGIVSFAGGGDTGVDPDWFSAISQVESRNNPRARSRKGAVGTMQTMPRTLIDPGYGVEPAKDDSDEERTRVGQDYFSKLTAHYGDPKTALIAYNWGPGNTNNWLARGANPRELPKETREYVPKVLSALTGMQNANAAQPTFLPSTTHNPSFLERISPIPSAYGDERVSTTQPAEASSWMPDTRMVLQQAPESIGQAYQQHGLPAALGEAGRAAAAGAWGIARDVTAPARSAGTAVRQGLEQFLTGDITDTSAPATPAPAKPVAKPMPAGIQDPAGLTAWLAQQKNTTPTQPAAAAPYAGYDDIYKKFEGLAGPTTMDTSKMQAGVDLDIAESARMKRENLWQSMLAGGLRGLAEPTPRVGSVFNQLAMGLGKSGAAAVQEYASGKKDIRELDKDISTRQFNIAKAQNEGDNAKAKFEQDKLQGLFGIKNAAEKVAQGERALGIEDVKAKAYVGKLAAAEKLTDPRLLIHGEETARAEVERLQALVKKDPTQANALANAIQEHRNILARIAELNRTGVAPPPGGQKRDLRPFDSDNS